MGLPLLLVEGCLLLLSGDAGGGYYEVDYGGGGEAVARYCDGDGVGAGWGQDCGVGSGTSATSEEQRGTSHDEERGQEGKASGCAGLAAEAEETDEAEQGEGPSQSEGVADTAATLL